MAPRILLLDGDSAQRSSWARLGRARGLDVVTEATVSDARATLAAASFVLVICEFTLAAGTSEALVRDLFARGRAVAVLTSAPERATAALHPLPVPVFDKGRGVGPVLQHLAGLLSPSA